MAPAEHFRVSTHLKDVIGRDLVVNEFVAVFELVKNSIDAGASRVGVGFDLTTGMMEVVDDGKGMSRHDITEKWLFVAYSAKRDGTEDSFDYRDKIRVPGRYAGSKGIGRFSCDTLGAVLDLYSRAKGQARVEHLRVNWAAFESDSKQLFQAVDVELSHRAAFPGLSTCSSPQGSGTALVIGQLRTGWNAERIGQLRAYLAKLIDPFGTSKNTIVETYVIGVPTEVAREIQGPVGNNITDVLRTKTTRIVVDVAGSMIQTELVDRGKSIYRIREPSPYIGLTTADVVVHAELFFLNRSAKSTFARRMQVNVVEFGSVFLFLNGFRIFPIGEESDDTFGLNRRKQQGSSRYFGTRDLIGKVEVQAAPGVFREASSRDAGLIDDANSRELYDALRQHVIFRLEKYVVGVNWPDKLDNDRDGPEGLLTDAARSRVIAVIRQLVAGRGVEVLSYAPDLVDTIDERSGVFEKAMKDLVAIAEREGSSELLTRIEGARARHIDLEKSEQEAQHRANQAMLAAQQADVRIAKLEQQARFLSSTQDLTAEQMMLILHQVMIYSGHISAAAEGAMKRSKRIEEFVGKINATAENDDLGDLVGAIDGRLSDLNDSLNYIYLENDRLMTVARFATHMRFDLETDTITEDVLGFISEYIKEVRAARDGRNLVSFDTGGLSLRTSFKPVDLVVVLDNLIDNALKADAHKIEMKAQRSIGSRSVEIVVMDDGKGIDERRVDPQRIFDKGYTSGVNGTGLGLYHARLVMEQMGGSISLSPNREARRATFIINLPGKVVPT